MNFFLFHTSGNYGYFPLINILQLFFQINEEDYLQNQNMSPAFEEFMELMSEKVTLKDFPNYRGGLDVKYGQTGEHSYYTNYKNRYFAL